MHDVNRLLKLVEVLLKMMVQVHAYRGGRNPFPGTNEQGIVELITQPLQRLADRRGRNIERFCCLADA